jgi:hypothetical protein
MKLSLAVLVALTAAASAYPLAAPVRSAAERHAREAEFRKRNAEHFTVVEAGERGFIRHVVTDDPKLATNGWEAANLRAFLRRNADLFGFDPATADRLPGGGASLLLTDVLDGALLGEINVQGATIGHTPAVDITVMFWVDAKPTLTAKDLAKRVTGGTYDETIGYAPPPQRDCAMTPMGAAGCKTKVEHTRKRQVTLPASAVRTRTWVLGERDRVRLVVCADAGSLQDPEADPSWRSPWGPLVATERALVPRDKSPALPMVLDAVTGDPVNVAVKSCDDPVFVAVRDR